MLHRFEKRGHPQYVDLTQIVGIDPGDDGQWCTVHLRGGGVMSVVATPDEVHGAIVDHYASMLSSPA